MPVPGATQHENVRGSASSGTAESSSSLVLVLVLEIQSLRTNIRKSLRSEDEDEHENEDDPEAIRSLWLSRSPQPEFSGQNDDAWSCLSRPRHRVSCACGRIAEEARPFPGPPPSPPPEGSEDDRNLISAGLKILGRDEIANRWNLLQAAGGIGLRARTSQPASRQRPPKGVMKPRIFTLVTARV
jgi:hypothetical protein